MLVVSVTKCIEVFESQTESEDEDQADEEVEVEEAPVPGTIHAKDAKITQKVAIKISLCGKSVKDLIEIGLFGEIVPKTVENFFEICTNKSQHYMNRLMTYNNVPIHRVIQKFMMQTGDFTKGNGTGGGSIYGEKFPDENFDVLFEAGVIAMANSGKDTNGSQFFITFGNTDWLNGRHTVFGRVIEGMHVVKAIERYGSRTGATRCPLKIISCQSA